MRAPSAPVSKLEIMPTGPDSAEIKLAVEGWKRASVTSCSTASLTRLQRPS